MKDKASLAELLRELQRQNNQFFWQNFADYLHDLSGPLHVASFCADEIKKNKVKEGSKLVPEKLESSLENLTGMVSEKRQEVKEKRRQGVCEKKEWERFLSSPFQHIDAYGSSAQSVAVQIETPNTDHLYESEADLVDLCGLYLLTTNMGDELCHFLETYFVEKEIVGTSPLMFKVSMNRANQQSGGLEFDLFMEQSPDEWKKFFQRFLTDSAKINYRVTGLSSDAPYFWKVHEWHTSEEGRISGKMGWRES